jgi:hypothetical protein
MHTVHMPSMWWGGWVDGWMVQHIHIHIYAWHIHAREAHTHTHHLGVLVGGGGVHACTRVGGACVQSKACAWGKVV